MSSATIIGINDEVTTCECCGRSNLKHTVVVSFDGGDTVGGHFGCVCAAKIVGVGMREAKRITESMALELRISTLATRWLADGHPRNAVVMGIWDRFGCAVEETQAGIKFKVSAGWNEVAA